MYYLFCPGYINKHSPKDSSSSCLLLTNFKNNCNQIINQLTNYIINVTILTVAFVQQKSEFYYNHCLPYM